LTTGAAKPFLRSIRISRTNCTLRNGANLLVDINISWRMAPLILGLALKIYSGLPE
jgi:hypothetical protein